MKPEMGEFIQTRSRGVLGPAMCTLPETSPVTQHLCLLGTLLVGFELELSGPRGGIVRRREVRTATGRVPPRVPSLSFTRILLFLGLIVGKDLRVSN